MIASNVLANQYINSYGAYQASNTTNYNQTNNYNNMTALQQASQTIINNYFNQQTQVAQPAQTTVQPNYLPIPAISQGMSYYDPLSMQNTQQTQQTDSGGMMQQFMAMLSALMQRLASQYPNSFDQTQTNLDPGSSAWGDPHFVSKGKDGKTDINFTQAGKVGDTYNVFKGDGYEVDAKYKDAGNNTGNCEMGEAKVQAGADTIDFKDSGVLTIDGQALKDGDSVTLRDGTKVSLNGKAATITSNKGDGGQIKLDASAGYINVDPTGKMSGLGGILGTAIDQNKNLTEDECNQFDLTNTNRRIA